MRKAGRKEVDRGWDVPFHVDKTPDIPETKDSQAAPAPAPAPVKLPTPGQANSLGDAAVIGAEVWRAGLGAPNPSALAAPRGAAHGAVTGLDAVDAVSARDGCAGGGVVGQVEQTFMSLWLWGLWLIYVVHGNGPPALASKTE